MATFYNDPANDTSGWWLYQNYQWPSYKSQNYWPNTPAKVKSKPASVLEYHRAQLRRALTVLFPSVPTLRAQWSSPAPDNRKLHVRREARRRWDRRERKDLRSVR